MFHVEHLLPPPGQEPLRIVKNQNSAVVNLAGQIRPDK